MNYKVENGIYIANDGYCFANKNNGATGVIMCLAEGDFIGNYDCIEKPVELENPEEPTEEIDYEIAYNEMIGAMNND